MYNTGLEICYSAGSVSLLCGDKEVVRQLIADHCGKMDTVIDLAVDRLSDFHSSLSAGKKINSATNSKKLRGLICTDDGIKQHVILFSPGPAATPPLSGCRAVSLLRMAKSLVIGSDDSLVKPFAAEPCRWPEGSNSPELLPIFLKLSFFTSGWMDKATTFQLKFCLHIEQT